MGGAVAMETGGIEAQEVASHFDQRQGSCCASVRARSCCRVLSRWASVLEKVGQQVYRSSLSTDHSVVCANDRNTSICDQSDHSCSTQAQDEVVAVLRSVHVCERSRKPEIQ